MFYANTPAFCLFYTPIPRTPEMLFMNRSRISDQYRCLVKWIFDNGGSVRGLVEVSQEMIYSET